VWGVAVRGRQLVQAVCLGLVVACASATAAHAEDLYWTSPSTDAIMRASSDGSGLQTLLTEEGLHSGVAVGSGHIYWTWSGGIGRANPDGSDAEPSFIKGKEGITGVAVFGQHIYWAGPEGNIGRANINGTEVEPEFIKEISGGTITAIAVSPEFIYWSNFWHSSIGRAHLDGSSVENEYVQKIGTPMGLAFNEQYFYWAITYENHIGRALLNGSAVNRSFIATGLSSEGNEQVGVAVDHQHIYWVNPTTGTIGRANLNGTEIEPSFITGAGDPLGLTIALNPEPVTRAPTEPTTTSARLNGSVNPNGSEVSECVFEYGTTEAYGQSEACSPAPGSGYSAVAVSASLTKLAADTTYHYRVSATNAFGTSHGADETLTTLLSSESASTEKSQESVTVTDKELTATANGGTGTVTVGDYGSDIGGSPLSKSAGAYIDVYRSAASTFKTVAVKDCELDGGRSLWWYNPETGWEPISEPPVAYSAGPPACITVTFTASTTPSVAQLTGTRFGTRFGNGVSRAEAGKCEAAKAGNYTEGACLKVAEKKGVPDHKGKYEWYVTDVPCFALKHGYYTESKCATLDEKKGVVVAKGKYEVGSGWFETTGKAAALEIKSVGTLECKGAAGTGELTGPKTGWETVSFTGCVLGGKGECASAGQAGGAIKTDKLGVLVEAEGTNKLSVEFFPLGSREYQLHEPIMSFSCAGEEYTLQGDALGQSTEAPNSMNSISEWVFGTSVGAQELETVTAGKAYETTLTASETVTAKQGVEINTDP
jgi:virginiamycin B lyase